MKHALAFAIVLTVVSTSPAQPAPPALMIKVKDRFEPLSLTKVITDVRIHGHAAETKTTMTFTNPHPRVLEGDLYFPLPQGSTVSGYSLDIKGVMVDGVAVEKVRARQVFESIVRQGIDPGLVEWTKGNNFKTRVFPIPAGGSRTISVSYITETDGEAAYRLPLNYKTKIKDFSLRIEVVRPPDKPKITGGPGRLVFAKGGEGFVAETHLKNVAPADDLTVALPPADDTAVLVERGPDGDVYFAIQDSPPIPEYKSARTMPRHVVIYWDASGSRGATDHKREIELMKRCLDSFLPNDRKSKGFTVDLVLFRNAAAEPKRFRWANLNWADQKTDRFGLVKALNAVEYDGGTQMASITPWPDAAEPDFYLLFTDGLSNFGREDPTGLKAPVYAFSDSARANHSFLEALAMKTGGRYFNLKRTKDDDVINSVGRSAFSFLSATAGEAGASEMYPSLPQPVTGRFMLAGKLTGRAKSARVTLGYGRAGKADVTRPIDIDGRNAPAGTLLRRLWAQKKLADLLVAPEANREAILHLGKDHGLVTPYTSLIVLDSLEQYVEHRIAPPKSLAKMRQEYMRRIDTVEAQTKAKRTAKIKTVLGMWQARVAWWKKEFKYPKDFKYAPPKAAKGQNVFRLDGVVDAARAVTGGERDTWGGRPSRRPATGAAPPPPRPPAGGGRIGGGGLIGGQNGAARDGGRGGGGGMIGGDGTVAESVNVNAVAGLIIRDYERPLGEGSDNANLNHIGRPSRRGRPGIAIKPWDPKTPYLTALKMAKPQAVWGVYMTNRAKYGTSPAFFLDCADFFHRKDNIDRALQVLSNIAELELENAAMLRVLGQRLVQTRRFDLAVLTFEQVMRLRGDEPQSYRDLALALAARAEAKGSSQMPMPVLEKLARDSGSVKLPAGASAKVIEALKGHVGKGKGKVVVMVDTSASMALPKDGDGPKTRTDLARALDEALRKAKSGEQPVVILSDVRHNAGGKAAGVPVHPVAVGDKPKGVKHMTAADARALRASVRDDYARAIGLLNDVVMKHWQRFPEIEVIALMELNRLIPAAKAFGVKDIPVDKRLLKLLACDVRIVMTWDADNTDIDLHIIEPSGERCYYQHNRTTIGGLVTRDFTQGYGPEEYTVRKAMHGVYAIEANYYGSSSAKLLGAVTLRVDIFTDFGREGEQHRSITLRLKDKKEIVKVGKIEF